MKVKIKKLRPDAVIPKYAKVGDAGMDLVASSIKFEKAYIEYGTGIALEIPAGYVGLVFPRSSISNLAISLCNSVGVIDSGYRNEVMVRFYTHVLFGLDTPQPHYNIGDRIAQLIIMPYPLIEFEEVKELSNTERGHGGFGSTGK